MILSPDEPSGLLRLATEFKVFHTEFIIFNTKFIILNTKFRDFKYTIQAAGAHADELEAYDKALAILAEEEAARAARATEKGRKGGVDKCENHELCIKTEELCI